MNRILRLFDKRVPVRASAGTTASGGGITTSAELAAYIAAQSAISPLQMAAVLRCVDLLSGVLAMLPMRVLDRETKAVVDHPLAELIQLKPNNWQTPFEFKKLMEMNRLCDGEAFAQIIRLGRDPVALQPLREGQVERKQLADWSMRYRVTRADGTQYEVADRDMLHIRDLALDGDRRRARVALAQEVISTARLAEIAQRKMFENGQMAGGWVTVEGKLSDEAFARLKADFEAKSGTDGAGKWIIGEEGLKPQKWGLSGLEAQTAEARAHQIEEVARVFGVPRALLMLEDTNWGSGVEQMGEYFIQFGHGQTMVAWEQRLGLQLFNSKDLKRYEIDIDERKLARGSLKDQAEYYAKASGAGGHPGWMHRDEIRRDIGEPPLTDQQKADMEAAHGQAQSIQDA